MISLLKIISALVIVSFLVSSSFFVLVPETKEINIDTDTTKPSDNTTNDNTSNQNNTNKEDNETGNNKQEELTHYVFVEEATATTCRYCPLVATILDKLYISGNYHFYYISLVEDKSEKAYNRIVKEYNRFGLPSVYIDGGYRVITGAQSESDYMQAILDAEKRTVPAVSVNVTASYDENNSELVTSVVINNYENITYTGRLRLYLSEKISRWYNTITAETEKVEPYHFSFVDYITNEQVTIDPNDNLTLSYTNKLSDFAVKDLDYENLVIFGVLFNSEKKTGYSNPQENKNEFDAYYADAADKTEVVEGGNTPPAVGIINPQVGKIHVFGKPILKIQFANTFLIGKTTIEAVAKDDSGIKKVDFYIDDELLFEDTEAPYEYTVKKIGNIRHLIRKHTIKVVAYDDTDKSTSSELDVFTILL
ncbi:MAG: hypothetical protein DRQ06_05300 [Candidatus Hydrothermota bacterium]|nr:MAG: hypothetical protein DRQ06_05300 [Candidatus Hydrothermae bacterium]